MKPEGVKSAKWFASWVWTLGKENVRAILRGLRRTDGSEAHNDNVIYTSSERFRDELMRVCLHAGYAPRASVMYDAGAVRGVDQHTGTPIVARHANWRVSYADGEMYGAPVLHAARDIQKTTYTGRTWCVSVPHGFIIARRVVDNNVSVPIIMGNCMLAHGASAFLKERMLEASDNFEVQVCKGCGLIAVANKARNVWNCTGCGNTTEFSQVRIPYAYKLFLQELESMNISSRILPETRLRTLANGEHGR